MTPTTSPISLAAVLALAGSLNAQQTTPALSPEELAARRQSVVNLEAHIEQRNHQIEQFSTGGATAAVPVMQDEAHDLDLLVESARNDLREDFLAIFRKYAELNRTRAELKQLQDNLAARKAWLEQYSEEHPR